MIVIIIPFCRKKTFLRNSIFLVAFSIFWNIHVLRKTAPQTGIPFPGARARSEPFSSSRAHRECNFPDFAPKMEIIQCWLPNRKISKIPHFWSKNYIFAPMAPTLINVLASLAFWDQFSSSGDSGGGGISLFLCEDHFSRPKHNVAPSSLQVVRGVFILGSEKPEGFFCD